MDREAARMNQQELEMQIANDNPDEFYYNSYYGGLNRWDTKPIRKFVNIQPNSQQMKKQNITNALIQRNKYLAQQRLQLTRNRARRQAEEIRQRHIEAIRRRNSKQHFYFINNTKPRFALKTRFTK